MGERVFVYMPAAGQGEAYKFAKRFQGPFRITTLYDNGVELKNISKPGSKPIRVALNRVRRCPKEMKDTTEESGNIDIPEEQGMEDEAPHTDSGQKPGVTQLNDQASPWEGRLRTGRIPHSEDTEPKEGEM